MHFLSEGGEMEEHLKGCPFCGQRPEVIGGLGEIWVVCRKCGAGQNMVSALDPDKLISAWNTRVVDTDNQRLREALEAMVEMVEMNGFGKAYCLDIARAALKEPQ
jgi:ribosomal protein L37AE/L43A